MKVADPQKVPPVPGTTVAVKPPPANTAVAFQGAPAPVWPSATGAELSLTQAKATQAGVSPVFVAGTGAVRVQVMDQAESAKAGIAGLLVKAARTDKSTGAVSLSVDYNGFRGAYGGDWASRLRLVRPGSPDVLPQHNDTKAGRLTGQVEIGSADTVFAVTAAPEGASGTYTATSLAESGQWKVSQQTGSFSWSYPMRVPPAPGGLEPQVGLGYDSGSVDGRVPTANNQTSWLGEGWNYAAGFIERRYKGCLDDMKDGNNTVKTGDQCWFNDNATLSMGSQSGQLVRVGTTNQWRLKNDDGSKLELLTGVDNGDDNGEHWKLTTTDGTQYFFGRNKIPDGRPDTNSAWTVPVAGNHKDEPCRKDTFDASFCDQAYRWNLDYVVDTHGNTMIYTYAKEANKYARNLGKSAAPYTRGGSLLRIDYGTRAGDGSPAPAQVVFQPNDRCLPGKDCGKRTKDSWPDVPWDRQCDTATCGDRNSPAFFTTQRLASVTTQIRDGSGYKPVERWSLNHSYPLPGDGQDPALWLDSIGHEGLVGTVAKASPVTFILDPNTKTNRVNSAPDGLPLGNKHRIKYILTESGGQIDINYRKPECAAGATPAPDTNTKLCFPVRWAPDKVSPVDDWFHKYVVESIAQIDRVGGAPTQFTSYDYEDGGAWAYNNDPIVDAKYRSWSQWRGYKSVRVRQGDPRNPGNPTESATRYHYFRGMHGDKVGTGGTRSVQIAGRDDVEPLAGFLREEIAYQKLDGAELSATVTTPKVFQPSAVQGDLRAVMVKPETVATRTTLAEGPQRKTESSTTYDEYGFPKDVNDLGDLGNPDDDRCTHTSYARKLGTWQLSLVSREETVGVKCSTNPVFPRDAISDTRTYYDGKALHAEPEAGNATKVEKRVSYGTATDFVPTARSSHDRYGRVVELVDAADKKSTTKYTPDVGLATSITETNALEHTTVTQLNPAWNLPTRVEGPNKERTDTQYDGLGRTQQVWAPGRSKDDGWGATARFAYTVTPDKAPSVRTEQLKPNGNYVTSYALFDGFLRERQTQEPSPQGGRKLTDIFYDTRGLVERKNAAYFNDQSGPADSLFSPDDAKIPAQTVTRFDGAGRPVEEIFEKNNTPQWSTLTTYGGNHITVIPPAGGTPTRTYSDAKGQQTELREYTTRDTNGPSNATKRTYTKAGKLATITDAIGNVWSHSYDVAGNLIRANDPDKGETAMAYDTMDRLVKTTDARGRITVNLYDDLGRKYETREGSTTGRKLGEWSYDKIKDGELDATTRYVGTDAYVKRTTAFDAASRPTQVELVIPPIEGQALPTTFKTSTTYLPEGSTGSVTLPKIGDLEAETVLYGYSDLGLPTSTTSGAGTYVANSAYTALNELTQLQLGTGNKRVWLTKNFEEGTRRLQQSLTEREDAVSQVDRVAYRYDPNGNVTQVDSTISGADRQCYTYDGLRRLTDAWTSTQDCAAVGTAVGGAAPYWNTYEYDAVGRRKSLVQHGLSGGADTRTTTAYPAVGQPRPHAPQSVTSSGPQRIAASGDYSYDRMGNTETKPGGQSYEWDSEGQLASATVNGLKTTYVNTLDNERLVAKQDNSTTLYLASGELKLDKATKKVTATRYYLHGGEPVAARTGKNTVTYLMNDRQGTANLTVDAATLQAAKRRFDPFGLPRGTAQVNWPGERGFVSGSTDAATGLTRLGVRDYDPATGTFVSVDPVLGQDTPQQLNAYSYAVNNPATLNDATGEAPQDKPGYCVVYWGDCGFDPVLDVKVPSGRYTPQQVKRVSKAARVGYGQKPGARKGILTPIYWNKRKNKPYPVGMSPYDLFDRVNWTDKRAMSMMQQLAEMDDCTDPGRDKSARTCTSHNTIRSQARVHNDWLNKNRPKSADVAFSVCLGASAATFAAEACVAVDTQGGVGWSAGTKRVYGPGGIVPGASAGVKMSEGNISDLGGKDSGGSVPVPYYGFDASVGKSDSGKISFGASVGTLNFSGPALEVSNSVSGYFWGGR
ncbi:hypothetical protein AOZ06_25175 [Kibdelosporangium phytohabitans]|uniref:Intein C-terminal splicing domain-containing protein n=1 Tax=Kibdelosporangium phytohabitans TaxID=860235 RepID=A0A0N9I590_9PSEU|nr:hypothetical protein AOZ06_25175 [Kibdelosporangium phytohabitans]